MTSKLALGTEFENIERLKHECRHYAIENAFEFKTLRSTRDRYTIACKAENCGWRLYAFAVEGSSIFRIRTFNPDHSCFGINHRGNQQATSSYIANRISEKLREQPEYPPVDIVRDVQRELGVKITYSKAFRAKETGIAEINGSYEDAYKALPQY